MPIALLGSVHFSTLEYVLMVMMFLDLIVAPLTLILLLFAVIGRRGMYGTLRVCGWLNLILVVPYIITSKYDPFFAAQAVIWVAVLVVLAMPSVRPRVFGESFDPLERDVGP